MDDLQVIEIAVDHFAVAAFLGYLLLIIGLGIYSARFSSRGISEFFIGGRKMNRFVVALSAVVSGRSAWLLLGVTGAAYLNGASADHPGRCNRRAHCGYLHYHGMVFCT
ncbi:MAG: hypothetical protein ABR545_03905 [Cyclonatronaceae bacterium]